MNGAFYPLKRFMNKAECESVLTSFSLPDGTFWPMPLLLTMHSRDNMEEGKSVLLSDAEGIVLAEMKAQSVWKLDKKDYVRRLFKTEDFFHPGVYEILKNAGDYCLAGDVKGIDLPRHYDFPSLRHTPVQFKEILKEKNISRLIAFNTRNPMHRAHYELTRRAMEEYDASLLIHPVVGPTKPGDIDYVTRVKCYHAILKKYPESKVFLSLLPMAMQMAGPREALLHGIIRKNYGCTHFIVGRDHASPGADRRGKPFYGTYEAQELFAKYEDKIGIKMVPFKIISYLADQKKYIFYEEGISSDNHYPISGTQVRQLLEKGEEIPKWFSFPEVIEILRKKYPPKQERGLVLFFTGLPASGKSTIARLLKATIEEKTDRSVSLLDGDIVRKNLSSELGFSKKDRDINIRRIGFVANEIAEHKGICLCSAIAPCEETRQANRRLVTDSGHVYVEIYVSTPLSVCEQRDPKGLYAQARQGSLKQFTGIDDPFEPPQAPEIVVDASSQTPGEMATHILNYLLEKGFICG